MTLIPLARHSGAATESEVSEDAQGAALGEVVVTARRTAESMQDVPVAISAMSAADLQREAIGSTQDLQGRVPSLTISSNSQNRSTESPTIRGQGATFGSGPGVAIYYAEVPLPMDSTFNGQGGPGKFFDISNLQVLKGSQGTLFGRNTTGGALLIEPHKPDTDFLASLMAERTSFSGEGYEAILNVPLASDTLLARASFKYADRDGFTKDISRDKDIDDKHFWTSRFGLTWRPTERFENYLLGYYTDSEDNGTGAVIEGFNPSGLNYGIAAITSDLAGLPRASQEEADLLNQGCALLAAQSTNCGADIAAEQDSRGVRHVALSADTRDAIKTSGVINQSQFNLDDRLALRNILSFSTFEHQVRMDSDGSSIAMQDVINSDSQNVADSRQITEELQLQGKALDDALTFVVGAYYQRVTPEGFQGEHVNALGFDRPLLSYGVKTVSYAPYSQGTYNLGALSDSLKRLSATAGIRYTTDKADGFSNAGTDHTAELEYHALTYTLGLDYATDYGLMYGKISRGYKAGGMAVLAVVPDDYTFDPEYVTNYEIGHKTDFELGTMPARVNTAFYYTDYTDMQRAALDSLGGINFGGAVFTAGEAVIQGVEVEATLMPLDNLTLAATYAYTHGEYKDYKLTVNQINPILDCNNNLVETGDDAELDCVPFQYSPRHQASLTAIYEWLLDPSIGDVSASVTYAWTDDQYSSSYTRPQQEPGAWLDSFGLLNASVRWTSILGSNFDMQIYGTNLTDEEYRISNSNTWTNVYFRASFYGEPRILGAQFTYHWGA
jgi:iron complex outermembrane receptor protein